MSFWNNPEYSSVKVVVIIAIVVGLGYFGINAARNSSLDQSGRVYEQVNVVSPELGPGCDATSVTFDPATADGPSSCTVTDCYGVGTTYQFETDTALSYTEENYTESAVNVAAEICSGTLTAPLPTLNTEAEKGSGGVSGGVKQPANKEIKR